MNFLNFNFKKGFLLLLLIALPLISINTEQKKTQTVWYTQPIRFLADSFRSFFAGLSTGVRGTTAEYLNLLDIKTKNRAIESEMSELRARMLLFEESQNEVERLRTLLDFKQNTKMELIPAPIVSNRGSPTRRSCSRPIPIIAAAKQN